MARLVTLNDILIIGISIVVVVLVFSILVYRQKTKQNKEEEDWEKKVEEFNKASLIKGEFK
jgi:preprotein translocase subunit YajC